MADYGFIAQGFDPVAQIGKLATVQNQLNENRLFQGQTAAGQAFQQSINPETGLLDSTQYNKLIRANPRIAPYAADALKNGLEAQSKVIANTTNQTSLQTAYTKNLTEDIGGQDPNAIPGLIVRGVATGRYPQDVAAAYLGGGLPIGGQTFGDRMSALSKQSAIQGGSATAMEAAYGSTDLHDTGSGLQGVNTNRVTGQVKPVGEAIAKTLTPEAKLPRVNTVGPQGQPQTVPQGALADDLGNPKPVPGVTGPHGELGSGLPPGVGEARRAVGEGSGKMLTDARADAAASGARVFQLQKADAALADAQTGHGAQRIQDLRSVLTTLGIAPASEVDKVKSFDEANKYLTAYALNAASSLGQGTDSKLAAALTANASTKISNLAARDVVKAAIGLERMKQAQVAGFEASGEGAENYGTFAANWAKNTDPRAFIVDQLPKDKRAAMVKGMSAAEQKRFLSSLRSAISAGVVNAADLGR